jgi:hypothetical protein
VLSNQNPLKELFNEDADPSNRDDHILRLARAVAVESHLALGANDIAQAEFEQNYDRYRQISPVRFVLQWKLHESIINFADVGVLDYMHGSTSTTKFFKSLALGHPAVLGNAADMFLDTNTMMPLDAERHPKLAGAGDISVPDPASWATVRPHVRHMLLRCAHDHELVVLCGSDNLDVFAHCVESGWIALKPPQAWPAALRNAAHGGGQRRFFMCTKYPALREHHVNGVFMFSDPKNASAESVLMLSFAPCAIDAFLPKGANRSTFTLALISDMDLVLAVWRPDLPRAQPLTDELAADLRALNDPRAEILHLAQRHAHVRDGSKIDLGGAAREAAANFELARCIRNNEAHPALPPLPYNQRMQDQAHDWLEVRAAVEGRGSVLVAYVTSLTKLKALKWAYKQTADERTVNLNAGIGKRSDEKKISDGKKGYDAGLGKLNKDERCAISKMGVTARLSNTNISEKRSEASRNAAKRGREEIISNRIADAGGIDAAAVLKQAFASGDYATLTCGCGKPLNLTRVYQADVPGKNTRTRAALSMLGRCKEPWCAERMPPDNALSITVIGEFLNRARGAICAPNRFI